MLVISLRMPLLSLPSILVCLTRPRTDRTYIFRAAAKLALVAFALPELALTHHIFQYLLPVVTLPVAPTPYLPHLLCSVSPDKQTRQLQQPKRLIASITGTCGSA
jgi:hypothetical protein